MAECQRVSQSVQNNCPNGGLFTYCLINLTNEKQSELSNFSYDGKKLKWNGDLVLLKQVTSDIFDLEGYWSSPGGKAKKFTSLNAEMIFTWYPGKQNTLNFQGKDGYDLRDECKRYCQERYCQTKSKFSKSEGERMSPSPERFSQGTNNPVSNSNYTAECRNNLSQVPDKFAAHKCECMALTDKVEALTLDIEILKSRTDSLQAFVNSHEQNPPVASYDVQIEKLEVELLEAKHKSKSLEDELSTLKQRYNISQEENVSQTSALSLNHGKDSQGIDFVYEQMQMKNYGNQRGISSKTKVQDKETSNWNNLSSDDHNQIEKSESSSTNVKETPIIDPSKKKTCLNLPSGTRPLPQIPQWLNGLPLIETPMLFNNKLSEESGSNKRDMNVKGKPYTDPLKKKTCLTPPTTTRLSPQIPHWKNRLPLTETNSQSYNSPFLIRQRKYRPPRCYRTKEWENYLDFVHQATRNC